MSRPRKSKKSEAPPVECDDPVTKHPVPVRGFIPCIPKRLPVDELVPAARTAVSINPANAPVREVPIYRIAIETGKYWGAKGLADVPVAFMESCPNDLAQRILAQANRWGADGRANVKFRLTSTPANARLRITRSQAGYWSYEGTDNLHIPVNQATMCFQSFTMNTPESEFRRVVPHEFGHFMGCPHEHLRRALVARLDESKTIQYFMATQGWTAEEVRQQVLTPIEERALLTPTAEDDRSIMCYQLPGSITKDGRPIVGGTDIDSGDAAYIVKLYPGVVTPPPPPPTGNGFTTSLKFNPDGTVTGTWAKA